MAQGPKGRVWEHRWVLYEKIGPGPHPCHWCGAMVNWGFGTGPGVLTVDHLDNVGTNNVPENLVPSCHTCNCTRQRKDLIRPGELSVTMTGQSGRKRAVLRTCRYCGKEFAFLAADRKPTHGQFCSRSCARRWPHRG